MKKLVRLRKLSQTFCLGLFVYILWSTTYPLEGLFSPQFFFKIDPLIMLMTSLSERGLLPGILLSFIMLWLTFVWGRFFCGWVCPLGTLIDVVGYFKKDKEKKSTVSPQKFRNLKYYILGFIVVFAVFGKQIAWFFDPIVIIARFVSLNFIPSVTLAIDKVFVFCIRHFEWYGPVYDFYRELKRSFLGINIHFVSNAGFSFLMFLCVMIFTVFFLRFWCRYLCPLGALYACVAKNSLLERRVSKCVECGQCEKKCRMGAIHKDFSYQKEECILCMDCIYDCHKGETLFKWKGKKNLDAGPSLQQKKGMSRRDFLLLCVSGVMSLGFKFRGTQSKRLNIIRPPASLKEESFLNTCVRCGNCMKVCPTNGLQPVMFESGMGGVWTPQLVPEIGYCEYHCTLCGDVCPTGAIVPVSDKKKQQVKLGVAKVDRSICLTWADNTNCLVCEEHCPVAHKAIKAKTFIIAGKTILRPIVDVDLCVGCGICQNKCPVQPVRAIRVFAKNAHRF